MKQCIIITMIIAAGSFSAAASPPETESVANLTVYSTEGSGPPAGDETEPSGKDIDVSTDGVTGCTDEELAQKCLEEAAGVWRDAAVRYEQGDTAMAREQYRRMWQLFSASGADCDLWYRLKNELALIFARLGYEEGHAGAPSRPIASLPLDPGYPGVKKVLASYSSRENAADIRAALRRSGRYRTLISAILQEYALPEELVYLPLLESMYDNNDRSAAGAAGLWQLMPERARALGLKVNFWVDERKDIEKATRAAARYLRELYLMFDDWPLALAAYNRGEYGLARDLERSNTACLALAGGRGALPRETELFVPRFIACALIGKYPERYGGFSVQYEKPLRYDTVVIKRPVDLKIAARCAGCAIADVRLLNPSIKAWCTPYRYAQFALHLPAGTGRRFLDAIAAVGNSDPEQGYIKYSAVRGERLDAVARRFSTTVGELRLVNRKLTDAAVVPCDMELMVKPGLEYLNSAAERENERG